MVQMLNGKPKLQQLTIKPLKIGGWGNKFTAYEDYQEEGEQEEN